MYLLNDVARIPFRAVQSPKRRRIVPAVRRRIPLAHAEPHATWLRVGEEARGEVVTKTFAHGARLVGGPEARNLGVLDRVSVFVKDDLGILRVVYTAGAKCQRLGHGTVERVVVLESGHVHANWPTIDVIEPQALDVPLRPVDVEIDHDLLEGGLGPPEQELPAAGASPVLGRSGAHKRAVQKPG